MAKEEEDYQIQMRWEADQGAPGERSEGEGEVGQRNQEEGEGGDAPGVDPETQGSGSWYQVDQKKLPEPPETLEAAERLTQEAMAAVMRGDKCPDRADKKREFEDAERVRPRAAALCEKLTGKDTMETAIALNRLGWHLKVRGKYSAVDTYADGLWPSEKNIKGRGPWRCSWRCRTSRRTAAF